MNRRWLLLTGLFLWILETGIIVNASIPWLLGRVNADDFFYYLVLARNAAAGLGPTFDGLDITNGFHPLYLGMLIPLAKIPIQDTAFLIKAGLVILLFFHNATGLVIGYKTWQISRGAYGWLAALMWLLNPWALIITLYGVEVPIAVFLWAVIIYLLQTARQRDVPLDLGRAFMLGLLLGLTILARTDGLMLLGAILVTEFFRALKRPKQRTDIVISLITVSIVVFLTTLPWWWWNLQHFGTISQVSGKAVFLGAHGFNWYQPDFIATKTLAASFAYFARAITYGLLPLLVLGFTFWKRKYADKPSPAFGFRSLWGELDFAFLAIVLLALWYAGWQWHIQNWYLLSTVLVATIIVAIIVVKLDQLQTRLDIQQVAGVVFLVSLVSMLGIFSRGDTGFPRQANGYYLARWLNQHTEADAVIGAWNSGIIGYFTDRTVVNLDGVVNNSIYEYRIQHRAEGVGQLMPYIRDRQITYLTDYEYIYFAEPETMGMGEVYESPEHEFRVYQLIR